MNKKQLDKTSKFISLILRHKPEVMGIKLDNHGWAKVSDLLSGLHNSGYDISLSDLEYIVQTDNKQRYSFDENKEYIRANQGHSIDVDVELEEKQPPDVLYHGTSTRSAQSIKVDGIKHMSRLYVHLSQCYKIAENVGSRHGEPVVLTIDTKRMYNDGIKFYLSKNGVWLTEYVDTKYIKEGI